MFVGTFTRSIDRKGRLLVPADMVRTLDAADREGFYLAPGEGSILLFKRSTFHRLAEGMSSPTPFVHTEFNRTFFGQAAWRPTDGMGRLLLPEPLRNGCGIGGEAVLVGCGEYLEIWAADRHAETVEKGPSPVDLLRRLRGAADGKGPATSR